MRRIESNLLSSLNGSLVQAVAQPSKQALHPNLAGSREEDLEHHGAFDAKLSRLFGVGRLRLEENLYRRNGRGLLARLGWRWQRCLGGGVREAGGARL